MHKKHTEAYGRVQRSALTDRETEAAALMQSAAMLKHCQTNWSAPDRDTHLHKALKYNRRLWSLFQVALADADNPLPKDIRENILRLSLYIDKRTFELMADPAPDKLDILININTNIAAGLKGTAA